MSTQLTIFDFLPSSESQVDEIPVIKNNLVSFPIKEEKVKAEPIEEKSAPSPLQSELNILTAWLPIVRNSNAWKKELDEANAKLEKTRFEMNCTAARPDPWGDPMGLPDGHFLYDFLERDQREYDDALAGYDRHWATEADLFLQKYSPGKSLSTDEVYIECRIEYLQSRLDATEPKPEPIPLTKAEEFPHLSPEVLACVSDLHRQPIEYRQQLAKDLAEYNATPDAVLKERIGVLPNTVVVETVAAPKPEPVQLTPVRWSVARGETHLMAPGAKSPICGAPDGREGVYTATGEPYSWQTCVRGLTPMCQQCERLEHI